MSFDASKYTKSKWLHGSDLPLGQVVTLTIKEATEHAFDDGTTRPVIRFYELDQALALNKTQTSTLIGLFGTNAGDWIAQRVELMATPSNYAGKPTILIRRGASSGPTINGQPVVTQPTPPAPAMPSPQPTQPAAPAPTMPSPQPAMPAQQPAASDPASLWGNTAAPASSSNPGGVTFQ